MTRPLIAIIVLTLTGSQAHAQSQEEFDLTSEFVSPSADSESAERADTDKAAELIVERTNDFRRQQGLDSLKVDAKLKQTAADFANYMAVNDKYGHRADGRKPSERASAHEYNYCIVLENIAYQFRTSGFTAEELVTRFVKGWKESEGHRENMLDPDVTETGVAVARSAESGKYYAVQMFGRPSTQRIVFEIVNKSGETVQYKLADRDFELLPRYSRTHRQCRPSQLDFNSGSLTDSLQPDSGTQLIVDQGTGGKLKLAKRKMAAASSPQ